MGWAMVRLACCFGRKKPDLARVCMGCKFSGGRTGIARAGRQCGVGCRRVVGAESGEGAAWMGLAAGGGPAVSAGAGEAGAASAVGLGGTGGGVRGETGVRGAGASGGAGRRVVGRRVGGRVC